MRSKRVKFHTLDVFTDRAFAGNQLAVIPDATRIPDDRLQAIAREFNYAETVFCYPPKDARHSARVRIFTPGRELPFAGHPTIGTAVLLVALGVAKSSGKSTRVVLEERVGAVPVRVWSAGKLPAWAQLTSPQLPEGGPPPPPAERIAAALSLDVTQLVADRAPAAFSCGVPFLFVELVNRAAVAAAQIDMQAWRAALASYWAPELFVFARDPELAGSHFHARMFAPGLSVVEDPATGGAVAALAGYLNARDKLVPGRHKWRIEQGFEMGRPSILELESDTRDGRVYTVRVGGNAVVVSHGELLLPN